MEDQEEKKEMLFAIDIDGTVAADQVGYAQRLNSALKLEIPEDIINTCTSYHDFAELPSVQLYRRDPRQNARYREIYESLEHDPDIERQLVPMPGSVEALNEIASDGGRIIYVTCRKPEAEALTREWLTQHKFPFAKTATICEHYHAKFLVAHNYSQDHEQVILIDDKGETMLKAFIHLARYQSNVAISLIGRLFLVNFGTDEKPSAPFKIPFPVFALPSWQPEDLLRLEEEAEQALAHRREKSRARKAG